jgi:hypothetical protein
MNTLLPSSKLKRPVGEKFFRQGNWEPIFCANCGTDGGYVPKETTIHAFWLCNDCWQKHGEIAGAMTVPDEEFWKKLADDKRASSNIKEL